MLHKYFHDYMLSVIKLTWALLRQEAGNPLLLLLLWLNFFKRLGLSYFVRGNSSSMSSLLSIIELCVAGSFGFQRKLERKASIYPLIMPCLFRHFMLVFSR